MGGQKGRESEKGRDQEGEMHGQRRHYKKMCRGNGGIKWGENGKKGGQEKEGKEKGRGAAHRFEEIKEERLNE